MKNKLILILIAIIGSVVSWKIIDFAIIEMPIWKYLVIETIIVLNKILYDKEKNRFSNKS